MCARVTTLPRCSVVIRRGEASDLSEVAAIQAAAPEAAVWNPADYLDYEFLVALFETRVAGFVVVRTLTEDEHELLNLAVLPEFRRRGIGRSLLQPLLADLPGVLYLEVRESNGTARKFYQSMGFQEFSVRPKYYDSPPEAAIVMKFHSC
jgi:ribosomal-protein-alanine N-acetyltransferase